MPKEKVTVTLDSAQLTDLRSIVGSRSLSAAVDKAVGTYLNDLKHLAAVDDWLAEMEREHGPVPPETLEWAAQVVGRWVATADLAGGAAIATVDTADLRHLAAHATNVSIADLNP